MKRRNFLRTAGGGIVLSCGLAGCLGEPGGGGGSSGGSGGGNGSSGGGGTNGSANGSSEGSSGTSSEMNLAVISGPGGFGDKAYNDKALGGLQRVKEEFGASINRVQGEGGQYGSLQSQLAESSTPYDLIVCVGFYQASALKQSANQYPDQRWMIINQGLFKENGEHFENVAGYVWANHEMSYLAGVAAATMTTRDFSYEGKSTTPDQRVVGFVGGVDSALIRAFEQAYVAGVKRVDESIEATTGYAGSFEDPSAGKQVALAQYDQGADVIYHAAAGTGPGIFQAAQERDRFAIGVDADQSVSLPQYAGVIVGSAVKYIDVGTFQVARGIREGNWDQVGGKHVLGLGEEAVEFVKGELIGPELPDAVDSNLEEAADAIVAGDVTVPCQATGCQ